MGWPGNRSCKVRSAIPCVIFDTEYRLEDLMVWTISRADYAALASGMIRPMKLQRQIIKCVYNLHARYKGHDSIWASHSLTKVTFRFRSYCHETAVSGHSSR